MTPRRVAPVRSSAVAALALVLVAAGGSAATASAPVSSAAKVSDLAPSARSAAPRLVVSTIVDGLSTPWDVARTGRNQFLVTERDRKRLSLVTSGSRRTVRLQGARIWASGETGLMSVALAPGFTRNRIFYTCSGWRARGTNSIQVRRWKLSPNGRKALNKGALLSGIPIGSGRHGGCRLLVDAKRGDVWVGTGDTATSGVSRNLNSLGGKVLRVRANGTAAPENPWSGAAGVRRFIWSYGHRNVQGLAQKRAGAPIWSVEHGPSREDEVNRSVRGGDFGWDPTGAYDESVPMTDQSLPGTQVKAVWNTGNRTKALSGATWVRGRQWGALNGTLAVATLKDSQLLFLKVKDGRVTRVRTPRALNQTHGRLRSVRQLPNGDLVVTTSNTENDAVLRIRPAGGTR